MHATRERLTRIADHYNQRAPAYAKQGERLSREWFDEPRRRFRRLLGARARVIDIGCGPGLEMADLSLMGLDATGLDVSREQLRLARDRLPSAALAWGTALALPFAPASFDGAWASASLHHLTREEAPRALAEIRRALVDGGAFYCSVQRGNTAGWIDSGAGAPDIWYTFFGEREWQELLASAGFAIHWFFASSETGAVNEGATGWLNSLAVAA